jgi:mycoredoxin
VFRGRWLVSSLSDSGTEYIYERDAYGNRSLPVSVLLGKYEHSYCQAPKELFVLDSTIETPTTGEKIVVYATTWCGDCRMAKRWFDSHGIPYEYINIEQDENAVEVVLRINGGMRSVPTIIFPDGSVLVEPSPRELAAKFSV